MDANFRSRGSLYNSCAPITFGLENESLSLELELGFRSGSYVGSVSAAGGGGRELCG